jgi:hypothetical protein
LAWVFVAPLIGLLAFWLYTLIGNRPKEKPAGLPFCDRHRGYWPRRAWFVLIGFMVLVAIFVAAGVLTTPAVPGKKEEQHWLFGVAGFGVLVYLLTFLGVHLGAMRPTGGDDKSLVLSGASEEFASALEGEGGRASQTQNR